MLRKVGKILAHNNHTYATDLWQRYCMAKWTKLLQQTLHCQEGVPIDFRVWLCQFVSLHPQKHKRLVRWFRSRRIIYTITLYYHHHLCSQELLAGGGRSKLNLMVDFRWFSVNISSDPSAEWHRMISDIFLFLFVHEFDLFNVYNCYIWSFIVDQIHPFM